MSGVEVRVTFGNPSGWAGVEAQLRAQIPKAVAEEAIERVQKRVDHPSADSLRAVGTNQWSATIEGPRGGPGIIQPIRAKALRFSPKSGGIVFAKKVQGVGLGPLIEAEASRVSSIDTNTIRVR